MRGRLVFVIVGVLAMSACAALHPPGIASGPRVASPIPTSTPSASTIQLSVSATAVWALVDYLELYRSTDQGSRWGNFSIPEQFGVRPVVSFIDVHEGWLLAPGSPTTQCQDANAAVWHTTDAGKTWRQLAATGIASAQCKNGIWFADAKRGFVSAWDDRHAATIYRTSDGGTTWNAAPLLPNPPNYQSAHGGAGWRVMWIKSFGSNSYIGPMGTPYIFESTDGGESWKWVTKTPTANVVLVTPSRWLDFSDPDHLTESLNGGQAFGPFKSDFNSVGAGATQVVFADKIGYASSDLGLQRTTDGGTHWDMIKTSWP